MEWARRNAASAHDSKRSESRGAAGKQKQLKQGATVVVTANGLFSFLCILDPIVTGHENANVKADFFPKLATEMNAEEIGRINRQD